MTLEFYTYPFNIKNNYSIINCKHWLNFKKKKIRINKIETFSKDYKKVILEPEVLILRKLNNYRFINWLNIYDFLSILPKNCYFSLDFPLDMLNNRKDIDFHYKGILIDKFLLNSFDNSQKYGYSKNYISTIQFKFNNFTSFKHWFNLYNNLGNNSKILGIGNLCRMFYKRYENFLINIFNYINENINKNFKQVHIYGLGLRFISLFYEKLNNKLKLSFDSTKWTKSCNNELKLKYGLNCNLNNRQEFFNEYCNTIKKRIIGKLLF